jgi:hypothetical protein
VVSPTASRSVRRFVGRGGGRIEVVGATGMGYRGGKTPASPGYEVTWSVVAIGRGVTPDVSADFSDCIFRL